MSQSDKTETKGDEEMKTCIECKSMTPKNHNQVTVEGDLVKIDVYGAESERKGKVLLDKEDYKGLERMKLTISSTGYARVAKTGSYLHRLIMGCPEGKLVDHINRDKLDNRKFNLRVCDSRENNRNRKQTKGKYKGVYRSENGWIAQITAGEKRLHIGSFDTEEEAALAYNEKAVELHGEFAFQNIVDTPKGQWEVRENKQRRGEKVNFAKLTEKEVKEIRYLFETEKCSQSELGDMYGVSCRAINLIVNRKTWKHI
jgi:hypothetical protein